MSPYCRQTVYCAQVSFCTQKGLENTSQISRGATVKRSDKEENANATCILFFPCDDHRRACCIAILLQCHVQPEKVLRILPSTNQSTNKAAKKQRQQE